MWLAEIRTSQWKSKGQLFQRPDIHRFQECTRLRDEATKSAGLGSHVRKPEPLMPEEEILWDKGILGDSHFSCSAEHHVLLKQSTLRFKVTLNTANYATTVKSKWLSDLGKDLICCILRTLLKITKVVSKGGEQVLRR